MGLVVSVWLAVFAGILVFLIHDASGEKPA